MIYSRQCCLGGGSCQPLSPTRLPVPLRPNPFEQNIRRLVIRVLRHKLAPERLCQNGLIETVDELTGRVGFAGEAVDAGESRFYPFEDPVAHSRGESRHSETLDLLKAKVWPSGSVKRVLNVLPAT